MNWISNVVRPKIRNYFARRDTPENLWIKCPDTGQLVFYKDVEANQFVIPGSNYHMRIGAMARLKSIFDNETWFDIAVPAVPLDPLKFRDERRYTDRLKDARSKTGTNDAIKLGFGKLEGLPVVIGVQDFEFMGGSLGMAAGEAVIKGLETAVEKGTPFIVFAASGGARMQEGILSLMQLPRTTVAVQMLREARKPYIVVLTNPTTGGVTASYAMLGDVHIAEPGALIGFAGPRVIEQTIREKLPEGFQRGRPSQAIAADTRQSVQNFHQDTGQAARRQFAGCCHRLVPSVWRGATRNPSHRTCRLALAVPHSMGRDCGFRLARGL
jgi:acetyl-CoA carboxylase carboxyl transferase subunit beta